MLKPYIMNEEKREKINTRNINIPDQNTYKNINIHFCSSFFTDSVLLYIFTKR